MFDDGTVWAFVVDTDKYAGNFERGMTAFCTGRTGECDVARKQAALFHEDHPLELDECDMLENCVFPSGYDSSGILPGEEVPQMAWLPDDHGCHRPTAIHLSPAPNQTEYNSVAMYFHERPTDEQVEIIKRRAHRYCTEQTGNAADHAIRTEGITIIGFRLFERRVRIVEHSVPEGS